ncbi:hypothetical protein P4654_08695 [Niallia taxi]|nr:hypothetical protein [Niallia taxi]MED4054227.1 hypothetical protein [Niallia taxi]MED4118253.1 hypothetical protein [Niallia taxi]
MNEKMASIKNENSVDINKETRLSVMAERREQMKDLPIKSESI